VANDANCPDDGLFCNGTEFCDPVNDCSSTGDPCPAGTTCNEGTDTCDAAEGDAWLDQMRAPKKTRVTDNKPQPVEIDVTAKGNSSVDQSVTVSLTGTSSDQNVNVGVSNSPIMQMVVAGDGRTSFVFIADLDCAVLDGNTYQVDWLAKIEQADQNSDETNDTVTETTDVVCVAGGGGGPGPGTEICDDGIDNDGDNKTDCADKKDCKKDPACQ
jgi:hypothetical protein